MIFVGLLRECVVTVWLDLYLIGKILLAPLLIIFALVLVLPALVEFVVIDIAVMLLAVASKSLTVGDVIHFMLMWE